MPIKNDGCVFMVKSYENDIVMALNNSFNGGLELPCLLQILHGQVLVCALPFYPA